jgi:hypothetical protein
MSRTLIAVLLLLPTLALAELVIELKDGRQIRVPVERHEIEAIRFSAGESQARSTAARPQTGPADPALAREPRTLQVGPSRTLKYPSDAARQARDGDIIEIDAGVYPNDYVTWRQNNLTLRGVGGMAHLKSKGLIPNRKAIWITRGNNTVIENVEFSGAAVQHTNGAGIRHEGGDLTLRNTFFHGNEFSILTGALPNASIEISGSRFWNQKRPTRHSHGIYIGAIRRFTLIGSHFTGTDQGHQVKSRALENHILYNRIEDVPGGNSSRLIDLSNCGLSLVIGNELHQGATTQNSNAIGYGPEGCERRSEEQMRLYLAHNTFVNEAQAGSFVRNFAGGDVFLANNLVFGAGELLVGSGVQQGNLQLPLGERMGETWDPPRGSAAIDAAVALPATEGLSLTPSREFDPPFGTRDRPTVGRPDIGARETGTGGSES